MARNNYTQLGGINVGSPQRQTLLTDTFLLLKGNTKIVTNAKKCSCFLLTAVKNQVTGNFILNAKSEDAEARTFVENGLQWEYSTEDEKETLKTSGPLHEGIIVLVSE